MSETATKVFTERALLDALRQRHTHEGNGGAGKYAFMTHVRTGAGHYVQEIDAVVLSLWESEQHDVHAFEVKCSRSDWLREIKPDTSKSARTRKLCDTFTVVAPRGVVRRDELPDGWGLLEATEVDAGITLRSSVKARRLELLTTPLHRRTLPRGFVVAMLRAAGAVPGMTTHTWRAPTAYE